MVQHSTVRAVCYYQSLDYCLLVAAPIATSDAPLRTSATYVQARGGQKLSYDNLVTSVPTLRRILQRETKENRVKLSYCRLIKQSKDQLGVTM